MRIHFLPILLAASATATAQDSLDEVVVTGRKIEHYQATDALTGTKSNALLRDLPITVSVVPHQLIEDRAISRLGEALDNVAGAQRKQGYGGVENFGAYLRGFDSSFLTLRDGIRDYGFYTLRDPANVERFEVLKGPGSVLYGAVYPGGITNTITKKPVVKRVDAEEFDKLRADKKNVILDVRSEAEFKAGHIPGATNIDVNGPDFAEKVAKLDKGKTYLVHCAAGRRSANACGKLEGMGFTSLFDLAPGFKGWEKAGKPVEK